MANKFTEELREAAGEQWDRVINHRFTTELASGNIDRNVLKKYLIQDHRFLDAFVILLSSAIAKARILGDRIPGCQFLGLITGKENTYFERSFEVLPCCSKEERAKIPDEAVTVNFVNLMKEVSYGGTLGEILSVLVVAEWSYLLWGEKVLPTTNRDDFLTYEWVDLHSGDYFNGVVAYLRGLLDKEGTLIDDEGKEKCKAAFLRAIQLEEDFFEMAYAGE
jgi:thiaminase/transcriptional activator TenA